MRYAIHTVLLMSWVFAVVGRGFIPGAIEKISSHHPQPLTRTLTHNLYIAAGGLPATCCGGSFGGVHDSPPQGWLVLGVGIRIHDGRCAFVTPDEWSTLLSSPLPHLDDLDGHFVALRWTENSIECFSDQFGMRTLYATRTPYGIALATRLDWIAHLKGSAAIDFEEFGAHWQTFNQLSYNCLLHDISRLGPGGHGVCTSDMISFKHTAWHPDLHAAQRPQLLPTLTSLVNPDLSPPSSLSLGLSGGLDSRVLLAMLLSQKSRQFSLHLFGHPEEPDVTVSRSIAADEGLPQSFLGEPSPGMKDLADLEEFVVGNTVNAPASAFVRLRHYAALHAQHKVVMDGGMGEIARRQFLTRLRLRGRAAMKRRDARALVPLLASPRASIFNTDIQRLMQSGLQRQIGTLFDDMPPTEVSGIEDFLDLFIVRFRFPNYGGYEQARMDGHIVSYMPFAQPSFVRAALAAPLAQRRNARLFREVIRAGRPSLMGYPLVKGTVTYPFRLPTVSAWLWSKGKTLLGHAFDDPTPAIFLMSIRDYVLDTLHSHAVKTFGAYDWARVRETVEGFYAGDLRSVREVDWWLAFEIWRRRVEGGGAEM